MAIQLASTRKRLEASDPTAIGVWTTLCILPWSTGKIIRLAFIAGPLVLKALAIRNPSVDPFLRCAVLVTVALLSTLQDERGQVSLIPSGGDHGRVVSRLGCSNVIALHAGWIVQVEELSILDVVI